MTDFPVRPEELSPRWLTDCLVKAGYLERGRVSHLEYSMIGTGKMADNARFVLHYEGASGSAPATLVAKFPAADEHARNMAGAQGAYYNEVMFYRELAGATTMRTPVIYGSELSEDRTSFLLLMADLSPAEPGSQLVGESWEHAALALSEAAKLAAAYYGDETLEARDHVMSPAMDDGGALGQALLEQSWPGFLDRFGRGLAPDAVAFGERYVRNHAHFVTRYQGTRTLIHGDFRSENILFHANTATTVDWQTTSQSSPLADAAYFLGGSVEIGDRREWERDLVEQYRVHLDEGGVSLGSGECWDLYREYAMHGLLITVLGAAFSTPDERGDRMFLEMIRRHLQHCIDLDAGEFLPA